MSQIFSQDAWDPVAQDENAAAQIAAPAQTYWQKVRSRLWANRPAMAGLFFILAMILAAVFGPSLSSHSYRSQNLKLANLPPLLQSYALSSGRLVYFNASSLNLYEIDPKGHVLGNISGGKRDLLTRRTAWDIDGQSISLDYARPSEGVRLFEGDTQLFKQSTLWNRSYLLGTDMLGRDLLARLLSGARISLTVAFIATLVNFLIGVTYGGIAGYIGGRTDLIMMRIVEIISTIPLTLYVILIMVFLNSGLISIVFALGTVFWVDMARIVRGQMLTLKSQDYVAAARSMGASTAWILRKHLLPNAIGPILVTATMLVPSAIFIESFMSFIGLGVSTPDASWGTLTANAVETLRTYPHQLFFPAAAISLTMFAFNFLGDGLRDALDPRSGQ